MNSIFFKKTAKAFTLVEMLVVVGLFSSIATLSLGALFNAQTINGNLQKTQAILDNINLSIQTMTRDIRFGSDFYATSTIPQSHDDVQTMRRNCAYGDIAVPAGCSVLVFRTTDDTGGLDRTVFYVENGILYKKQIPASGDPVILQMTSNEVEVTSLIFYVQGAQTSDGSNDESGITDDIQPLITVLISGITKSSRAAVPSTSFNIQTSISAREIDNR